MSEKILISSILIRLVLHRRIGWRGLFGIPIDCGRLPQNSTTSFPQPRENDAHWLREDKILLFFVVFSFLGIESRFHLLGSESMNHKILSRKKKSKSKSKLK